MRQFPNQLHGWPIHSRSATFLDELLAHTTSSRAGLGCIRKLVTYSAGPIFEAVAFLFGVTLAGFSEVYYTHSLLDSFPIDISKISAAVAEGDRNPLIGQHLGSNVCHHGHCRTSHGLTSSADVI